MEKFLERGRSSSLRKPRSRNGGRFFFEVEHFILLDMYIYIHIRERIRSRIRRGNFNEKLEKIWKSVECSFEFVYYFF